MEAAIGNPKSETKNPRWISLLALFTVAGFIEAAFWNQMNVFMVFPVAALLTALGLIALLFAARQDIAPAAIAQAGA